MYADNDPLVPAYAERLTRSVTQGRTACVEADVTDPDTLLSAVEDAGLLDFSPRAGTPARFRSPSDVARFFDGLDLIAPGIRCCHRWRPASRATGTEPSDAGISLPAGVTIKR